MKLREEDRFLIRRIESKLESVYEPYFTPFLDRKVQEELIPLLNRSGIPYLFHGGVMDAERRLLCLYPEYWDKNSLQWPLGALYMKTGFKAEHRKVLGSLLSLGIKRENIGDIQIGEEFVQIEALDRMREFLLMNYTTLMGVRIHGEWREFSEIEQVERTYELGSILSTSNRLDCIVSALFHLSRSKSQEAVQAGAVKLNWVECHKADYPIKEGDVLSLRKYGKARIDSFDGLTKKGRLRVKVRYYR